MPNGGVPMHLVMNPQKGRDVVLYCKGAELRVIPKDQWEESKQKAKAILVLNREELLVLERFLRYWLHDSGEEILYHAAGVNVVFDY